MPASEGSDLILRWSARWTLTHRILAINIFAVAILAGSLFYLDSFRERMTSMRVAQARTEVRIIADALRAARPAERQELVRRLGEDSGVRLRIYSGSGEKILDSRGDAPPSQELRDPQRQRAGEHVARFIDSAFELIVGGDAPSFVPPGEDALEAWPEAQAALRSDSSATMLRKAPEGTPYISAAAPLALPEPTVLLLTVNARDITRIVRDERLTLAIIMALTILLSVLLSLFLARTVALPLRRLARAAQRVRLGRAREVDVPLLPARRDEIGLLARVLHDMTLSLRNRIDATEAFAAEVTHELKNPLASLRSAVDSLDRVEDPELRRQLLDVVRNDVRRLDRLIVDIAEVSRLDAELSRARFEPVDLRGIVESLVRGWEARGEEQGVQIAHHSPAEALPVPGEETRLARAFDNLVDNAISFSPENGVVEIALERATTEVLLIVEDEGPGVPDEAREAIFNRFHSIRPEGEAFGRHSGLGLAIAKAIVEAHDGRIVVEDRPDGRSGARFIIRLPGAAP